MRQPRVGLAVPAGHTGRAKSLRILVVEDDPDLAALIVRVALSIDGDCCIDWVASYEAGRWRLHEGGYDLVLADFALEGSASGLTVLREVRSRQPETACALISAMPLRLPATVGYPFLKKPFTPRQLRAFVVDLTRQAVRG